MGFHHFSSTNPGTSSTWLLTEDKLLHLQLAPVRCKLLSIHVMFSNMPRLLSSATGSLEDEMVLPTGEHSEHLEAHYLFLASCDQSLTAWNPWFKQMMHKTWGNGRFVWLSSLEDVFCLDTRFGFSRVLPTCASLPTNHDTKELEERPFHVFQVPYIFGGGSRLMQILLPTIKVLLSWEIMVCVRRGSEKMMTLF